MTISNVKWLLVLFIVFFSVDVFSKKVLSHDVEGKTHRFCWYTPSDEIRTVSLSSYCPETKPANEGLSVEELQLRVDLLKKGTNIKSEAYRATAYSIEMDMLMMSSKYSQMVKNCVSDKSPTDEYIPEDEELEIRKACRDMAKKPSWIDELRYEK
jgi:hypothetical protein